MKTKSRNLIVVFLMALAMLLACIPVATLTANAELDSLENVSVNNGVVTWDAFPGAAEYSYSYGHGGGYLKEPSLDLELNAKSYHFETGNYNYSIYAVDEYRTQISEKITGTYSYTCKQTPLATPTNLTWDHTTAKWDAVKDADHYILYIYEYKNGSYSLITAQGRYVYDGTSYDMGTRFEVGKTYCFDVKACAAYEDLDHLDSEYGRSENKTFVGVVPSLTNVKAENGKLTFDAVTGASKYDISIGSGGSTCDALPINMFEICSSISLDDGVYDIRIRVYNQYNEPLAPEYTYEGWEYDSALAPAKLTGTLTVTGTLKVGETLTATLTNSNNTGTLTYTWLRSDPYVSWVVVQTGDSNTFVLTEACANKRMSVIVESDVEHSQVESANTGIVAEANKAENLTGTVNIIGTKKYGGTLTADVSSNNTGTLYYQWKRSGVDIPGATSISYVITVDDIGKILRVVVTSSVEVGSIASDATAVIEKANGASAPTGITATGCTNKANNDGTISGVTTAMEYKLGDGSWNNVTSTTINNLASGTYYIRIKETDTHKASKTASVVVNAYVALTYDVTFDANGGSGEMASVPVEENDKYTLPACGFTAPTGYEFKCWSVNEAEKAVGSQITITADTTITAVWQLSKIKNVEITGMPAFVVGGDIVTNASVLSVPANANYQIKAIGWYDKTAEEWASGKFVAGHTYQFSVDVVAKEGFEFGGYGEIVATVDGKPAEVYKNGAQIMVKYIVGEPISYTITFDANGGSGTMEPVVVGGNYVLPECEFTPPEGKTFDKWSVSGAGPKEPGNAVIVGEDLTITAMWKDAIVMTTISFLPGEGSGEMQSVKVEKGSVYTLPECEFTPKDKYSTFSHWMIEPGTSTKPSGYKMTVLSDYTLTAVWVHGCKLDLVDAVPANCATEAFGKKAYYVCNGCGNKYEDENGENVIANFENWGVVDYQHDFSGEIVMNDATTHGFKCVNEDCEKVGDFVSHEFDGWKADDLEHRQECACGYEKSRDSHSGGTATCTEKAICSVCNTVYGEALGHEAQDVWSTDGEYHWHECTRCEEQLDKAAHADENNDGKCDTCGYTMTVIHVHDYGTAWQSDENNHWNECACGDKANKAAHADANNDGKCDICDYAMGTPENPGGDKGPEKTGLSGGAIAGIAVGSVAVAGLGGLSLFWFVIKKKKFTDLIALFKKK